MVGLFLDLSQRICRIFSFLVSAMTRDLLPFNHDLILPHRFEVVQTEKMLGCQWFQTEMLLRQPLSNKDFGFVFLSTPGRNYTCVIDYQVRSQGCEEP